MASGFGTITVTTSATLIRAQDLGRVELRITNSEDATIVYLGQDNTVTTANGTPLYDNQQFAQTKDWGSHKGDVFGIVASGTADVRFWEVTGT